MTTPTLSSTSSSGRPSDAFRGLATWESMEKNSRGWHATVMSRFVKRRCQPDWPA